MSVLVELPASSYLPAQEAIALAQRLEWKDVLMIGYDSEGHFMQRSSRLTRQDVLWLLEWAKRELFSDV